MAIDTKSAWRRAEAASVFGQVAGGGVDMIRDIILKNMENKNLTKMQWAKWEQSMKMLQLKHGFSMEEIGAKEGAISGRATLDRELKYHSLLQKEFDGARDDQTKNKIAEELNASRERIAALEHAQKKYGGTDKDLAKLRVDISGITPWAKWKQLPQYQAKGYDSPATDIKQVLSDYIGFVNEKLSDIKTSNPAVNSGEGEYIFKGKAKQSYDLIKKEAGYLENEDKTPFLNTIFSDQKNPLFLNYSNLADYAESNDVKDTLNAPVPTPEVKTMSSEEIKDKFRSSWTGAETDTKRLIKVFTELFKAKQIPNAELPAWETAYAETRADIRDAARDKYPLRLTEQTAPTSLAAQPQIAGNYASSVERPPEPTPTQQFISATNNAQGVSAPSEYPKLNPTPFIPFKAEEVLMPAFQEEYPKTPKENFTAKMYYSATPETRWRGARRLSTRLREVKEKIPFSVSVKRMKRNYEEIDRLIEKSGQGKLSGFEKLKLRRLRSER